MAQPSHPAAALERGVLLRDQGHVQQSVDALAEAAHGVTDPQLAARIAGELGISQLQARRLQEAASALQRAVDGASGAGRARYLLYLGHVAFARHQPEQARRHWEAARDAGAAGVALQTAAALNLARLAPADQQLPALRAAAARLAAPGGPSGREAAALHLNLGDQARAHGADGTALAHVHLDRGHRQALQAGDRRLAAEASDALAQLYEDRGRPGDAMALTRRAQAELQPLDEAAKADLLIALEWRQARLLAAAAEPAQAIAAYERAVYRIEAVRPDIPIEYDDGRSSFRATLEPIYLGYADLLLRRIGGATPAASQEPLRRVRDLVELIKQTELQDFMGERCAVEAVQGGSVNAVGPGVAVLYPVILPDRLELLLETASGIERRQVAVPAAALRAAAADLADRLRNEKADFAPVARQLYDWLLRPLAPVLAAQGITALVVVPDGALRLVPFAALQDGNRFALEQYAISMATGMTMTNSAPPPRSRVSALVVGLSQPGPVIDHLAPVLESRILQSSPAPVSPPGPQRLIRSIRSPAAPALAAAAANAPPVQRSAAELESLRARLALPGVAEEVHALGRLLSAKTLLDAQFTVAGFRDEAKAGDYRVLHIASHGLFGGNAESSFIMAYDNLLNMDGLQAVLQSERLRSQPIELLSLSACQTAEGNDRAPLGMSGVAIKARAKSVLGTLWPVDDDAARRVMEGLYAGIAQGGAGKSEALRQAQLALARRAESSHPFYWAPFVLIGNWL